MNAKGWLSRDMGTPFSFSSANGFGGCVHSAVSSYSSGLEGVRLPGTRRWRVLEEKISQSKIEDPFLRNVFGVCAEEDRSAVLPS